MSGTGCFEFVERETTCLTRSSQRPPLAQQGSLVLARLQLPTLREVGTGVSQESQGKLSPAPVVGGRPFWLGCVLVSRGLSSPRGISRREE